ncbi:hypothetical protein H5410_001878 [Solanum commersonii]|uniref:Uncharacterized protein n=1 Tax=Solanum commersonii TaxID=4109 RepID=A0A9J6B0E4_SOLCO|nr:hypothetical protein H5410_001878 [Solanum commersonii]
MLLQITYQDKATQTEKENTIEEILKAITTLCIKVDSMNNEIQKLKTNEDNLKSKASTSQQNDYKNAELSRSDDFKNPELRGDDGKHLKTHNVCLNTAASTKKPVIEKQRNVNLNKLFEKPFTQKAKNPSTIEPKTSTYADSLQHEKKITTTKDPNQDYITQKLQGYNKLIAHPKTNANLVKTCYNYGLISTAYTYDGEELSATTEILHKDIKPPIQVVKIGLTKNMIIPEDIGEQSEIPKIEIPNFYANKRIIGISTITQELANNYLNGNAIWSYYSRYQLMIYANSRELRKSDMDEVQKWILSLLKLQERPTTKALKARFISSELLTRYCKLIGHKYPDHICLKCNGEDNVIPNVQLK